MTTGEKIQKIEMFGEDLAAQYGFALTRDERLAWLDDQAIAAHRNYLDLCEAALNEAISDPDRIRRAAAEHRHSEICADIRAMGGRAPSVHRVTGEIIRW